MSCLWVFLVQLIPLFYVNVITFWQHSFSEKKKKKSKLYRNILNLSKDVIDSEEEDMDLDIVDVPDKFYRPRKLFKGNNASLLNYFIYEN